ncbi:hypothetical protein GH714_022879 [Hevea brasiliensis]|uniref:Uncharacterized protein n=1 Tax=Hevea brasiliensis TaxID=3981 RepID=A0A6A6M3V3_HEVBR|nr:hypothetical protein GH714_022879 [Hevea brasiliensis]
MENQDGAGATAGASHSIMENQDGAGAVGKRLVSAGRRFQSMVQYGQGEMQKFGELQVEVTPVKANIGAVIGVAFG